MDLLPLLCILSGCVYLKLVYYSSVCITFLIRTINCAVSFWQCASAIDSLAAFYFNNITAGDNPPSPAALNLARHIGEFPSLFPQVCNAQTTPPYPERL